jgi:CubicO group peptidase (beta-lactamase class C family)
MFSRGTIAMTSKHDIGDPKLAGIVEDKLVPIIAQVIDSYGLAGLGVGIVKDGAVVLARGFGQRSLDTGEPVTARSLFHMASVSKPFVATAIIQLWESGRLDLDAPVTAYLPYFALKGGNSGQITIRQMLSHTGGVPDTDSYSWHQPEYDDEALERYVRSLAGEAMIAAPGERFAYSNPAFEVLGDVIARVSGQSFESYVKSHILDPLGMQDSTFLRQEVAPELATTPHFGAPLVVLPNAYPYHRAHAPSSTLHSSAADMCRWMLANLAHGTLAGRPILNEASYETLWHPQVVTGEETWGEVSCLGWYRGTYRGRPIVHHSGSDPGYFSDMVLLPEMQVGVMVMSNAYCATAWGITDAALDLMLGLEPRAPRRPITVPVGSVLQSAGSEAAIAEYRRLQATTPDEYDFDGARFNDVTWGAIEIHRPQAVMPLLEVWAALFPESAEAFEALGRAYLVTGESAAAARSLHTALKLNPESETIPNLLQRLDGG